ncbi:MAG: carboxypeptidase-like regulatory domain-containing protein [Armatimonadetes bacterium]|nr:carboxypeptidase-like regulatory domain-containing protein [Armatimonadota bacterium]
MKRWFSVVIVSSALAMCAVSALAVEINREPVTVSGVVADGSGKPISNAQVYYLPAYGRMNVIPPKAIRTDAQGRFTYSTTKDKMWSYIAVADGYSFALGTSKPDSAQLNFTLWPERLIKGKVVDELGKRVAGAVVKMDNYFGSSNGGILPNVNPNSYMLSAGGTLRFDVTSDKDGVFVLEHLPEPSPFDRTSMDLRTSKKGHASMQRLLFTDDWHRPGKNDFEGEIRLLCPTACTLEGKLSYPRNLTLTSKRFSVSARYETKQNYEFCYGECNVGQSGKYRIENLPPGKINLRISQLDREWEFMADPECGTPMLRDIVLKSGEINKVDIAIQRGAVVSGIVMDEETGKPMSTQLYVRHSGFYDESYISSVHPDPEGKFTIHVPAGDVKLSLADASNYRLDEKPSVSFKVTDGETKNNLVFNVSKPKARSAAR